jgi:drug/metabolite transporter (DMT)-like permease
VAPRLLVMLVSLSAIWGASYLFNEIALRELEPGALIEGRFLFALVALAPVVLLSPGRAATLASMRRSVTPLAVAALLNATAPFFLIAWGQQFIDSGLTGILIASSPLFTAVAALAYDRRERVGGLRLVGVLAGFAGVALLLGVQPQAGGEAVAGALAVLAASVLYAVSGLYIGRRLAGEPRLAVAAGTIVWAVALTLPAALVQLPGEPPGPGTLAALAALGVGGTAIGYLLYFGLIGGVGASRAILVNYLIPAIAVAYGVALLDEPVTASMIGGLALILAGVAIGTGVVGASRRADGP